MGLWIMAGLTFREAARRKILLLGLLLGLVFLALYGWGMYKLASEPPNNPLIRRQVLKIFGTLGLYAVNFFVVVMAVLVSVDTLAGEIRSGTIQTLASKPLHRWQIVLGKWAGFAAMLSLYILFMSGGVAGLAYLLNGVVIQSLGWVLALMWLESLVLLSVSFLGGTRLSTLATGVLAVGLHGLAFFGGWIEEFGAMAGSQTAVLIGQVASVIMPSESLWRRAAYEVQKPIIGGLGTGPFTSGSVPSDLMIVYAAFYMLAALGLAVFLFQQRDL